MKTQGLIARFMQAASVGRTELSKRTVRTYLFWIRKFHGFVRLPASEWTGADVERFLWWLKDENYSISSRKQALNALVYTFKNVIGMDIGALNLPSIPKQKKTLKIIPSREELGRVFAGMKGMIRLMCGVMYGSGLRVSECCELRVKDIDFEALTIRVHSGKGDKDRLALLPERLVPALQKQIAWRAALHARDMEDGGGFVELPGRLAIKYPKAARELGWQYLFPSTVIRGQKRWYCTPQAVQKALGIAVKSAGILKRVTPHTLRHAFATHAMRAGNDVRTIQELMGHEDLETTQGYLHADAARGVSPLDCAPVTARLR